MKLEISVAQLSIVDGAWQDAPDNIAIFAEDTLSGEGLTRGNLYVVTEVAGEAEGRDAIARQVVETVRRTYAASHGSVARALTDAIRAANDLFYATNAALPPEARRIAGITAAVLRNNELFSAQAGPGLACLMRADELRRYPDASPWYMADENAVADWLASRNFETPGAVPIGIRRSYTPDLFHTWLGPGDVIVLSTRFLVHLLSTEELIDTFAHRHPDEIVTSLEEIAGAADLSVIILGMAGENIAPEPTAVEPTLSAETQPAAEDEYLDVPHPVATPRPPVEPPPLPSNLTPPVATNPPASETPSVILPPTEQELAQMRAHDERARMLEQAEIARKKMLEEQALQDEQAEQERQRIQAEQAQQRRAQIQSNVLQAGAGVTAGLAKILGRINGAAIGNATDRVIDGIVRSTARALVFLIHAIAPGDPNQDQTEREEKPHRNTAWQLISLVFPILLIVLGSYTWVSYRNEQVRLQNEKFAQLLSDSGKALTRAKQFSSAEKSAALDAGRTSLAAAKQAQEIFPTDQRANKAINDAQDFLDSANGILPLFLQPAFLTLSEPQSNPARLVAHYPDVFVLDRGASIVYRYTISDTIPSATPSPASANAILKAGMKISDRTVGTLIDMMWIDAGRLLVLDRNGVYWKFDPSRGAWETRAGNDASTWGRINIVNSYANNLYLIDATNKQILKYVPVGDWWTSPVTFFNPGANPELTNVVDLVIDGDVWMLRSNGAIMKCSVTRCTEQSIGDLETPLAKPVSLFTSPTLSGLYIADAGNQRVVQMDKATGKFTRQFMADNQNRALLKTIKIFTADDKRFYFVSGGKAYFANIPQ